MSQDLYLWEVVFYKVAIQEDIYLLLHHSPQLIDWFAVTVSSKAYIDWL